MSYKPSRSKEKHHSKAERLTVKVYRPDARKGYGRVVDTRIPLIDTRFGSDMADPFRGVGHSAFDIRDSLAYALGLPVDGPSALERIKTESLSVDEFKCQYLIDNVLKKYDAEASYSEKPLRFIVGDKRAERAMEKFMAAEQRCAHVNENGLGDDLVILARVRKIIADILGPLDLELIAEGARFSGGGSTSRKRAKGSPYYKYHGKWRVDVTPAAYPYAYALIASTPLWKELAEGDPSNVLNVVAGSVVKFVYKNAEEYRVMCGEPDMCQYLQQGAGWLIRKCLKRIGIDLNDDSFNQYWARQGSIDNVVATIDKSSASDLTARRTVVELFPEDWAEFLISISSPCGKFPDGKWHRWEKISTMGNGSTFELESLIFYAFARAVQEVEGIEGPIGVFGDDLIITGSLVPRYTKVIEDAGFKVNLTKSHFLDTHFRESCGAHWYKGYNVKPFYIRKPIDTAPRVIWLLNRIRLWAYDEQLKICDPRVYDLWADIYRCNRHWLRKVRGGHDPQTIERLCSPGRPEGLLKVAPFEIERVYGLRGVLTHFNTCHRGSSQSLEIAQAYRYDTFKRVESKNEGLFSDEKTSDSSPVSHGIAISKPYLCIFIKEKGIPINHNYYFPSEIERP